MMGELSIYDIDGGRLHIGIGKDLSEAINNKILIYESNDPWDGYMSDEEMSEIIKEKAGVDVEVEKK